MTPAAHVPVLLDRVVELLSPALQREGSVLVDATLGLGGHTSAVLRHCPAVSVIGLDRDPGALDAAREALGDLAHRVTFVHAVYDKLGDVLSTAGQTRVDAVFFDLGVSSMQLDSAGRGFSYARDVDLDMRMDPTTGRTAADLLNTAGLDDLTTWLRVYGEERYARRIAERIVRQRELEPYRTSEQLVDTVRACIPSANRRTGGHPAKRTFQALRIAVNDEIEVLRRALPVAVGAVRVGGRVVVEAYQSLEDRLVKQAFAAGARADVPPDLPVVPERYLPELRLLTRGAERAGPGEIERNPRAQSVRLRAVERVRDAA
jgi:16S rRNA (cytosine1402-N4)-methyltransferase